MNIYIILAEISGKRCIKVGKAKNPRVRLGELQVGSPVLLDLISVVPCKNNSNAVALESHAHKLLSDHSMHGEWFRIPENWIDFSLALFRHAEKLDRGNPAGDLPAVTSDWLSLEAWAQRFNPPPSAKTHQRWARDGKISPPPNKIGRTYYVDPDAVYISRQAKEPV